MTHVHEPPVRTRTWPIGDMVSAGCARTLEKAVAALPGVNATSANFATATLQVSYDPARLSSGAVATAIRDCGFQCDASMPAAGSATGAHDHAAHARHGQDTVAAHTADAHAGHGDDARDAAGHDAHAGMNHGSDLHAAARDMGRRFLVALAFAIPVFVWSPMGGLIEPPPVPF